MHGNICTEAQGKCHERSVPLTPSASKRSMAAPAASLQSLRMEPRRLHASFFCCWTSLKARWRVPLGALQRLLLHMFREYETGSAVREHLKTAGKWHVIPSGASGAITRTPFRCALKPLRMLFHAFALSVTDADTGHLMVFLAAGHISNHAWS